VHLKSHELSISKVVVTGSGGFIGRRVVEALRTRSIEVIGAHRPGGAGDILPDDEIVLDLQDAGGIDRAFHEIAPDCVIHLAGTKNRGDSIGDYQENYQSNLLSTLNLIHSCRKLRSLKRFVFIGSCDEYGSSVLPFHEALREQPDNAYGLSKLATTQLLSAWHRMYGFPVVILRPSVVYGPGQGAEMFIPSLAMALASGKIFPMTKGGQLRDFLFIEDLVDAIIMAATHSGTINGEVLNIGAGCSTCLRDVALMTADLIGPDARGLIRFGALPYRPNEVMDYSVSIERAEQLLGWHPTTGLFEGLKQTVAHLIGSLAQG